MSFTRENATAAYRIIDVVGKNAITFAQYTEGMKSLGIESPNPKPIGYEQNKITMDVFVEEAMNGLKKL